MTRKIKTAVTSYSLYLEGDNPIFGESALHVKVDDEGAGPFLVIVQENDDFQGTLRLDFDEVLPLFDLLNKLKREHSENLF